MGWKGRGPGGNSANQTFSPASMPRGTVFFFFTPGDRQPVEQ